MVWTLLDLLCSKVFFFIFLLENILEQDFFLYSITPLEFLKQPAYLYHLIGFAKAAIVQFCPVSSMCIYQDCINIPPFA